MKIFAESESGDISYSTVKFKKSIQLCSKSITAIADNAEDLKAHTIILCCNQLSNLPQFGLNLKVLNLSMNQLKFIPLQLFNCVQLIELDLSFNKISRISRSIGKMVNLKKLNISNNAVGDIPQEIGNCGKLEILNLANNCIYTIPAEFSYLKNVKTVCLEGNPLYPVVNSMVVVLPSLRELAARKINDSKISMKRLPTYLQDYLSSGYKCSHCSNAFFETFVRRGRVIFRGNQEFPIEYKLCKSHWATERERINCVFKPKSAIKSSPVEGKSSITLQSSNSMESLTSIDIKKDQRNIRFHRALSFSFWKNSTPNTLSA